MGMTASGMIISLVTMAAYGGFITNWPPPMGINTARFLIEPL